MAPQRLIIMGAAGRDFHNFNTVFRDDDRTEVVAFTATQIPNIEGRRYPPQLAGPRYPQGIPIYPEDELAALIRSLDIDQVIFAYSDVSHQYVMEKASIVLAAGADFRLIGPKADHAPVEQAGRRRLRGAHRLRQIADHAPRRRTAPGDGQEGRGRASPDALRRSGPAARAAFCRVCRPGCASLHHRGTRGIRAAPRSRRRGLRGGRLRSDPARRPRPRPM